MNIYFDYDADNTHSGLVPLYTNVYGLETRVLTGSGLRTWGGSDRHSSPYNLCLKLADRLGMGQAQDEEQHVPEISNGPYHLLFFSRNFVANVNQYALVCIANKFGGIDADTLNAYFETQHFSFQESVLDAIVSEPTNLKAAKLADLSCALSRN